MKQIKLIVFISFACIQIKAQSIQRSVIGSAGMVSAVGNVQLSSTTGETATQILSNASQRITQGFQQGEYRINVPVYLILYLQGYYVTGTQAMNPVLYNQGISLNNTITDSIEVELHSSIFPSVIVASAKTILSVYGLADLTISTKPGNYYVVIKHRNTVETWSAVPYQFDGSIVAIDFSYEAQRAYGNNQVQVDPGVWAFYSGDINQDENDDLLDASILENDINNFEFGYFATDLNGDGNVDLLDAPILEVNVNNFIFSNHP